MELERALDGGGREKVCPFKDFGKAELVKGSNDGADSWLGADDEDFDRLSVGLGVAVKLEGKFKSELALPPLPLNQDRSKDKFGSA